MTTAVAPMHQPSREARAIRTMLMGTPMDRARMTLSAGRDLVNDPEDTELVFVLGMLLNRPFFPRFFRRFIDEGGERLLQERPAIDGCAVAELRRLPAHTLGGAYARFLDTNGLDPDLFKAPPGLPEELAYMAQRMRQTHDLWHVLTGYSTNVDGEVCVLSFTYGQTQMPLSGLIGLVGSIKFRRQHPGLGRAAWRAYKRGQQAKYLPTVVWEDRWEQPLCEVRQELEIEPLHAEAVAA